MTCRACGHHTTEVMDFGTVALAGAFLRAEDFEGEKKHPLSLRFCEKCLLLQTGETVQGLFDHYFYFSSATETMREHFRQYAYTLRERFSPSRVLEIGCNDGVLMKPLMELGIDVVGVDPARNVTDERVINAYWGRDVSRKLGKFDLILANNVFAHIPDINEACEAVANSLVDDGVFAFEVNRLDSMVSDLQYDWVYHEHLFYYSLLSLENLLKRHGLRIFDLSRIGTHAGSIRYFACKDERPETSAVDRQRKTEIWMKLDQVSRFEEFASRAKAHREEIRRLVKGKRVAAYGACGRTNTMLQWCGLDHKDIAFVVDDAPAKQGFYTPGTHIPITKGFPSDTDLLIVFAWSFMAEIAPKLAKYPGSVYVPLPHVYEHKERAAA